MRQFLTSTYHLQVTMIRYKTNPKKILEGVVWLANQLPDIDQYQVVKMFFFADKKHLNAYGRPIFGDKYIALEHGPIASLTLNAIKREKNFVTNEYIELFEEALTFKLEGNKHLMRAKREADLDEFSKTDIAMLNESFKENKDKSFQELREKTHKEPAWEEAWNSRGVQLSQDMDFRLFVDESEYAGDTIDFIENTHGCAIL